VFVKQDNPDIPTFNFDPIINPISAYKTEKHRKAAATEIELLDDDDLNDFVMPTDFQAILQDHPLYDRSTTMSMALLWAPRPFNLRTGRMRRCIDVPLVQPWFKERCNPQYPVKVRVSYQKLLKCWLLNSLHKAKPKAQSKRSLFKGFQATKFFQVTELDWVEAGLQVSR
jgi:pre-mRNA-processing factor 8